MVPHIPTDYDNRSDVDLLVAAYGRAPTLFRNMREGTFQDVAEDVGLTQSGRFRSAAAADVNKDGYTDLFLGDAEKAGLLALSDGRGRFVAGPGPAESAGATRAQFLDYDNDGLLDLLLITPRGARLIRNLGTSWEDVSPASLPSSGDEGPTSLAEASFAAGDLDGDGDTDLVLRLRSGALRFWENQGGNRNASVTVRLSGRVSNRSGIGAKVEMRAGSLRQRLETYAATPAPAPADVVLGLGRRATADAVRVIWPAGILQTELTSEPAAPTVEGASRLAQTLAVKELDRKPSSCPFLYAWNGEVFGFVTDFMGGGEMGYWQGPGVWSQPDPDEYVRLREGQLRERDGRYELRVTNELEEAVFVDRMALVSVAHPPGTEVFPNEGLVAPPAPPFQLFVSRAAGLPVAAVDDQGREVRDRIAQLDRRFVDGFALDRIRGYAPEHSLTLDLGEDRSDPTLLLLTGWTDYAFSSDNVAAHQLGQHLQPPAVQVQDEKGDWHTVGFAGIPVGRPQTVVFELSGLWRGDSRSVRLVTNMRIYWDQIQVASSVAAEPLPALAWLDPDGAELRERGFSRETSPDGREPFGYDYADVSWGSPWKVMTGRYTRLGDVRDLLLHSDDMFVVSRPGDEIAVSFDARALPPLPDGWKRTFLVYADGYSKEMDINSATPHSVGPLPFHGMTRYPYAPPESFPWTKERREAVERFNTRVVSQPVPPLELAIAQMQAARNPEAHQPAADGDH